MIVLQSTDLARTAQFRAVHCRSLDKSFEHVARKRNGRPPGRPFGMPLEANRQKPAASPSRRLSLAAT